MKTHNNDLAFDAFISYSGSRETAKLVFSWLSRAAAPPWQFGKWWKLKVFYDKRQIRAGDDLPMHISYSVQHSEYFVLLASKAAAQSRWVSKELEFWLRSKPASNILIVVLDGAIEWDEEQNDFNWNVTDCIPPILKGRYKKEPLWTNLRQISPTRLTKAGKQELREAIASIAAKILGVAPGDIMSLEDSQRKRLKMILGLGVLGLIVSAFLAVFLANKVSRIPADNLYNKGRTLLDQRENSSHIQEALDNLEQALEQYPNHVQALLGKAFSLTLRIGYGGTKDNASDLQEAQKALNRAEQYGGAGTSEYLHVQGRMLLYRDRDVLGARKLMQKAIDLDPTNIDAWHSLASTYMFLENHEKAEELCCKAKDIALKLSHGKKDKRYIRSKALLAWAYYHATKYDRAKDLCDEILENETSTYDLAVRYLGLIYIQKGDYKEALKYFESAGGKFVNNTNIHANYICALALAKQTDEARKNIEVLLASGGYVSPYRLAQCYATLGEKGEALKQLRRARDESDIFVVWSKVDPLLSSLRSDTEFQDYLASVGLMVVVPEEIAPGERTPNSRFCDTAVIIVPCLIVSIVLVVYLSKEVRGMPAKNVYSEGKTRLAKRRNLADVMSALSSFDQALKENPKHVKAWLSKADAHILLIGYNGSERPVNDLEEARKALINAEQYGGEGTSEYQYVQGRILLYKDRDVLSARASLAKAVEIDPHNIDALRTLADTYTFLGQHREAIEIRNSELSILSENGAGDGKDDKRHILSKFMTAWTYFFAGEYDLAKQQCEQILDVDPTHDQANKFLTHIYTQKRDYEEALKRYLKAGAGSGADRNLFAHYTCALALAGQSSEARKNIEVLLTSPGYVSPYRLAQCYLCLGERGEALKQLKRARDEGDIFVVWSKVDPLLSSLRSDTEFQDYLASIGLGSGVI